MDLLRQFMLFGGAYYVYRIVRGLVDGHPNVAFQHARDIVYLERSLHSFFEVDVQQWALARPFIIHAADWMYVNSHFVVISTGNHFWLDAAFGVLVAAVSAWIASAAFARARPDAWAWRTGPAEAPA